MHISNPDRTTLLGMGPGQSGFWGTVETALVDWIQLLQMGRRDAVLRVRTHDGRQATLWCRGGDVVDASCEGLVGEEAVYRALSWPGGKVAVEFGDVGRRHRIRAGTTALLLQAAARLDAGVEERPLRRSIFESGPLPVGSAAAAGGTVAGPTEITTAQRHFRRVVIAVLAVGAVVGTGLLSFVTWTWILERHAPAVAAETPNVAQEGGRLAVRKVPAAEVAPVVPPVPGSDTAAAADLGSLNELVIRRRVSKPRGQPFRGVSPRFESRAGVRAPRTAFSAVATPNVEIIDERAPRVRMIDDGVAAVETRGEMRVQMIDEPPRIQMVK